jgi:hypothetical protein
MNYKKKHREPDIFDCEPDMGAFLDCSRCAILTETRLERGASPTK